MEEKEVVSCPASEIATRYEQGKGFGGEFWRTLGTFDVHDHFDLPDLCFLEIWQISDNRIWFPVMQFPLGQTLLDPQGAGFQPFFKIVLRGHNPQSKAEPEPPPV